jgi:hypothetical protein
VDNGKKIPASPEEKLQKIRDTVAEINEIVPSIVEERMDMCWIENFQCPYGCEGKLSTAPVRWCLQCHRFNYALDHNEIFDELVDLWEENIREQALEVIRHKKTALWTIINGLIDEKKEQLGEQMFQVLNHFLKVMDEELGLDKIEVVRAEDFDELEIKRSSKNRDQAELIIQQ